MEHSLTATNSTKTRQTSLCNPSYADQNPKKYKETPGTKTTLLKIPREGKTETSRTDCQRERVCDILPAQLVGSPLPHECMLLVGQDFWHQMSSEDRVEVQHLHLEEPWMYPEDYWSQHSRPVVHPLAETGSQLVMETVQPMDLSPAALAHLFQWSPP